MIELQFRFVGKTGKFFLRVANPCGEPVKFKKGVPVASEPGHGIGVQSICAVVERYGGGCQFSVKNGQFLLPALAAKAKPEIAFDMTPAAD